MHRMRISEVTESDDAEMFIAEFECLQETGDWCDSSGSSCPADISSDNVVDGADLGLLLGAWGTSSGNADLNNDNTVDGADLGILLGAWGGC